jgi:hypothetical protein
VPVFLPLRSRNIRVPRNGRIGGLIRQDQATAGVEPPVEKGLILVLQSLIGSKL